MEDEDLFVSDEAILRMKELEQEIKGNNLFIYIDDTGNGGNNAPNKIIANNTKSYIAAVYDSEQKRNVERELQSLLFSLKKDNKNECHFVDIYNRQGEWKDIDTVDVINLFEYFSDLINRHEIPFFIQSCNTETKEKINISINQNKEKLKINKMANINYEFLIVLMLLKQVEDKLIDANLYYDNVYVTIDEGVFKKDTNLLVLGDLFSKVSKNAHIRFKSSKDDCLLQVSDYLAYSYLRHQYLNKKLIDDEEKFLNDTFYTKVYRAISSTFEWCLSDTFKIIHLNNAKEMKVVYDKVNKKS